MTLKGEPLLIRADANARMGTGHLMRCLALAQAWQSQGREVIFITACENEGLLQRLSDEGLQIVTLEHSYPDPADWEITSQVLSTHPGAWVVLDGYHFDSACQLQVKESGHPLLVIDDMAHLDHYYADVVLNQNIHAAQLDYSCEPYTRLLLGVEYVLLRSEFLAWREWQREIPDVARKVLVTLGGSDPDNQTLKVIRALRQVGVDDLEVVVVVGASNPHFNELQSAIRHLPFAIRLVRNVSNMPELMVWANLAISSGGTTCWELAFMGLPTIVGQIAEVENLLVGGLRQIGLFFHVGRFAQLSRESLAEAINSYRQDRNWQERMSRLGQQAVNGHGCTRILKALNFNKGEVSE